MRNFLVFTSALLMAGSASAQALNETFDTSTSGVFPPTGWSETNTGTGALFVDAASGYMTNMAADAAFHDYHYLTSVDCDDTLDAPTMDLSSYSAPEATFDNEVIFTSWMAHSANAFSNGASYLEVSTDGGATWSNMWQETAMSDGYYPGQTADLSSVANQASVDMRFRYFGNDAHAWGIDNVVVDNNGPVGPSLAVSGTCPGSVSLDASGMTAGGLVVFGYSVASGSTVLPGGPCAGMSLPLGNPVQAGSMAADASGNASFVGNAPANACGIVTVAAVDGGTCTSSNGVVL